MVRLPFPDVDAISSFVHEQLGSEDCRLTEEERRRNDFAPALLLLPEGHPLAPRLRQRMGAGGASSSTTTTTTSSNSADAGGDRCERTAASAAAPESAQEGAGTAAVEVEDAADVAAASCASILSLLLPPAAAHGGGSSSQPAAQMAGVLCAPLDLAGQDTPPFAAGLLPGGGRWGACLAVALLGLVVTARDLLAAQALMAALR